MLDLLGDDTFLQQKATLESEFCRAIEQIGARSAVRDVRCRGLLAAIQLADRPAPSWQTMFDAGLHAFSREDTVIVAPPFVSTCERLDQAFAKLAALLPD